MPMTELDRQVKEYKSACDAGRAASHTDAIWLLNELIAERDKLLNAVKLAIVSIDCERAGLKPDGRVREHLVSAQCESDAR